MKEFTYVMVRIEVLVKNIVRCLRRILCNQRTLYYYNYDNIRSLRKKNCKYRCKIRTCLTILCLYKNYIIEIYYYFATKRYKVYHLDLETAPNTTQHNTI